jgi:hypothetical protein
METPGGFWRETEPSASERASVVGQWNETEFCLYRYMSNCQYELITEGTPSDKSSEDQVRGSGFSSLSLVGSSVASDREHILREQIATKMSQGSLYRGSGQVSTVDPIAFPPPSQVYYCVLDAPRQTGKTRSDTAESSLTSPVRTDSKRQYVVCFASLGKTGLDLFRTELDSFCAELALLLPDEPTEEVIKSFPGSPLQSLMSEWFNRRVQYIARVVQLCHSVLPVLLHVAINSQVEVSGPNECNVRDVKLFLDTCSMANLMQIKEERVAPGPPEQNRVTVTVSHNTCSVSSEESSQFCSNWAQVLLAHGTINPDPFFLRQAVDNYRLKIVQDLNAFKRLLKEAESDYHALYRCYSFLSVCGNGKLLLECVSQEENSLQATDVLEVLRIFSQKNGFKKMTNSK